MEAVHARGVGDHIEVEVARWQEAEPLIGLEPELTYDRVIDIDVVVPIEAVSQYAVAERIELKIDTELGERDLDVVLARA